MKNIIIEIGLLILLSNCEKINDNCYDSKNQKVLFGYEYYNCAWGCQHRGWLVDSDGNVHIFEHPDNWIFIDNDEIINEDTLLYNLNNCDSIVYNIDQKELDKYTCNIEQLSEGEITEPENNGADMGEQKYFCFTYDRANKTYKQILIKVIGDWSCENLADKKNKTYNWLLKIDYELR